MLHSVGFVASAVHGLDFFLVLFVLTRVGHRRAWMRRRERKKRRRRKSERRRESEEKTGEEEEKE